MNQLSLAMEAPQRPKTPVDERIRARLDAMLDSLRGVDVLPWTQDELARWRLLVPQMTRSLPEAEAKARQEAFEVELRRLGLV